MKAGLSFGQTAIYTWNGSAGDGTWETGVSQANWDGGTYSPGNGGSNNFVFVDFNYDQNVNTVTLAGGHNPNVYNITFNANNFGTPFKIIIDGTNSNTHLDLDDGSTDSLDVTGNNYEIDSVNNGGIQLFGSGGIWTIGTADTFTVSAPIADTGPNNRGFQKRGAGTLILSGESTFDGSFDSGQGPTQITSLAVEGQPSAVGTGTGTGAAPIEISNCTSLTYRAGSLIYNGPTDATTDRPIQVAKDVRTTPTNISADTGMFTVMANTVTLTGGMATFPVGSTANPGVYTNYTVNGAGNTVLNTTGRAQISGGG